MNFRQLIKDTANITLANEVEVQQNLIVFLDCMEKALHRGETITLPLFGTFKKVVVAKDEPLQFEIVFTPSSKLNQRIQKYVK